MRKGLLLFATLFIALSASAQKKTSDPFTEYPYCYEYGEGRKTCAIALDHQDTVVVIRNFQKKGKKWKPQGTPSVFGTEVFEGERLVSRCDTVGLVEVDGGRCLLYSYLVSRGGGKELAYYLNLYSLSDYTLTTLEFSGLNISKKDGELKIEGQSRADGASAEQASRTDYLQGVIDGDPRFVKLSRRDYLSDEYIGWWLENNPQALGAARSVEFGTITEECSIYDAYRKAKKAVRGNLEAAVCDVRGYTVVLVQNRKTSSYLLVWAEPECRNRKTDRYLAQVYFQDANTLVLFYYKGKTTFKYRINLHTRALGK